MRRKLKGCIFRTVLVCLAFCFPNLGAASPPEFIKESIRIGNLSLQVEIADEPSKWSYGLMYRKSLPDNQGMLFVFNDLEQRSFWMKNTFIPLSIGFFDHKGVLFDIQDMEPVKSEIEKPKSYLSSKPAKYALEVNIGWFQKNKIKIGDQLIRTGKGLGL